MTRQCAWCGAELGQKCPRCGADVSGAPPAARFFTCPCGLGFPKGAGGTTHSICDACNPLRRTATAALPSAADLDAAAEEQRRKEATA